MCLTDTDLCNSVPDCTDGYDEDPSYCVILIHNSPYTVKILKTIPRQRRRPRQHQSIGTNDTLSMAPVPSRVNAPMGNKATHFSGAVTVHRNSALAVSCKWTIRVLLGNVKPTFCTTPTFNFFYHSPKCPEDYCDGSKCIDWDQNCDGNQDCADGWDEQYCAEVRMFPQFKYNTRR